jgi:hypothetical protein
MTNKKLDVALTKLKTEVVFWIVGTGRARRSGQSLLALTEHTISPPKQPARAVLLALFGGTVNRRATNFDSKSFSVRLISA